VLAREGRWDENLGQNTRGLRYITVPDTNDNLRKVGERPDVRDLRHSPAPPIKEVKPALVQDDAVNGLQLRLGEDRTAIPGVEEEGKVGEVECVLGVDEEAGLRVDLSADL
jgi:hypothetical protein